MKGTYFVIFSALAAQPALAQNGEDMIIAREIGQVISSAEICGYSLSDASVEKLMSERVAEMDLMSRTAFQASGRAQKVRLNDMNDTERKATCAMMARLASSYGVDQ